MSLRNRLLLALLFFTASITCATDQKWSEVDLLGDWSGVVVAGQVNIATELTVQQVEGGNGGIQYLLHYGPGKNCQVVARKKLQANTMFELNIDEASGGFCDPLWNATALSVEVLAADRLRVTMAPNPKTRLTEVVELTKIPRS
jgi:hypothetical protein